MEINRKRWQAESGLLPTDWEVRRLGDLAKIHDGTHQTPHYVPVGVPFFSVEHVTSGNFSDTKFISEKEHKLLTRSFKIAKGDILMTRIGSVGECRLVDWNIEASFYVSLALLKVHGAHAPYVAQYSNSQAFKQEVELHSLPSATPKKINLGPISAIQIVVPPIEEQRAIAHVLDDVDMLLSALDHLIAKKRDLKQAAMQQLLTGQTRLPGFEGEWRSGVVGDVVEALEAGVSVNSSDEPPTSVTASVLKTSAVSAGRLIPEECKSITPADVVRARLNPRANTILISRMNTPDLVGEVAYVPADYPWLFLPDRLWMTRFKPNVQIDVRWLACLLSSRTYQQQIKAAATGTSGSMKNISKDSLLGIPVLFPEQQEQTAIATVLSDMDAELAALETRREKTRLLKQGMMQELLTGKTRLITTERDDA